MGVLDASRLRPVICWKRCCGFQQELEQQLKAMRSVLPRWSQGEPSTGNAVGAVIPNPRRHVKPDSMR
jgi:hypothetical protein